MSRESVDPLRFDICQNLRERLEILFFKQNKINFLDAAFSGIQKRSRSLEHALGGNIDRQATDPRSNGRKGDADDTKFIGQTKARRRTFLYNFTGSLKVLAHASGMNDVLGVEHTSLGGHRLTYRNWTLGNGFFLNNVAAFTLYRPGDSSSHPQMVVGRVDNGIGAAFSDIALKKRQDPSAYALFVHETRFQAMRPAMGRSKS